MKSFFLRCQVLEPPTAHHICVDHEGINNFLGGFIAFKRELNGINFKMFVRLTA